MSRLTRDGTAEPVSRDQILRRERGQGNVHFPCSADHEQNWQPYPVDPYSCYMCDHTYMPGSALRAPTRATRGQKSLLNRRTYRGQSLEIKTLLSAHLIYSKNTGFSVRFGSVRFGSSLFLHSSWVLDSFEYRTLQNFIFLSRFGPTRIEYV